MILPKRTRRLYRYITKHGDATLPFFLIGLFIGLVIWDQWLHIQITRERIAPQPFLAFRPAPYPFLKNQHIPSITAQGVVIMDADSHTLLYEKNSDVRFSPASTTKIMTTLVALDSFDLSQVLTVWDKMDSEGSGLGLTSGEQMTFGDLLYGSLLLSANDAAYAIAENYPGGIKTFLMKMNQKAKALSLYNTYFSDPAGLDDDGDYTTPKELAIIADAAMQDPIFRHIVRTKSAIIQSTDKQFSYPIENRNTLLGIDGVDGIKTGSTQLAGQVLVTSAMLHQHRIYIIVMKSDDRFADTYSLLEFLKANLGYQSIPL